MQTTAVLKPDYGNWVSKKFIFVPGMVGLIFLGLAFRSPFWAIPSGVFLLIGGYFLLAGRAAGREGRAPSWSSCWRWWTAWS